MTSAFAAAAATTPIVLQSETKAKVCLFLVCSRQGLDLD
jgi:hypothetical protein